MTHKELVLTINDKFPLYFNEESGYYDIGCDDMSQEYCKNKCPFTQKEDGSCLCRDYDDVHIEEIKEILWESECDQSTIS